MALAMGGGSDAGGLVAAAEGQTGWMTSATPRCSTASRRPGGCGRGRRRAVRARPPDRAPAPRRPARLPPALRGLRPPPPRGPRGRASRPPVVVMGLPARTTHLVNVLADTRFRSMPWWEVAEPIPVLGDGPGRDGVDPRYLRCLADHEGRHRGGAAHRAHATGRRGPSRRSAGSWTSTCAPSVLEWHARVPAWQDHQETLDHHAHYAFLRRSSRVLSSCGARTAGCSKCPQHLERLGPLLATFPTPPWRSTCATPWPCCSRPSRCRLRRPNRQRVAVEADGLATYWVDRIESLLRAGVRDAHLIPEGRRVDVEFRRLHGRRPGWPWPSASSNWPAWRHRRGPGPAGGVRGRQSPAAGWSPTRGPTSHPGPPYGATPLPIAFPRSPRGT